MLEAFSKTEHSSFVCRRLWRLVVWHVNLHVAVTNTKLPSHIALGPAKNCALCEGDDPNSLLSFLLQDDKM